MNLPNMFVDDAKKFYKWLSTWVLAATGTIGIAWDQFQSFREYFPAEHFGKWITGLAVAAFIARIVRQTKKSDAPSQ